MILIYGTDEGVTSQRKTKLQIVTSNYLLGRRLFLLTLGRICDTFHTIIYSQPITTTSTGEKLFQISEAFKSEILETTIFNTTCLLISVADLYLQLQYIKLHVKERKRAELSFVYKGCSYRNAINVYITYDKTDAKSDSMDHISID